MQFIKDQLGNLIFRSPENVLDFGFKNRVTLRPEEATSEYKHWITRKYTNQDEKEYEIHNIVSVFLKPEISALFVDYDTFVIKENNIEIIHLNLDK